FIAGVNLDNLPEMHKAGYSAARPGGWDPKARLEDMAVDGVSAEVLYPSLGLGLYWIEDPAFQEACFRAYNDWLIEFCAATPDRRRQLRVPDATALRDPALAVRLDLLRRARAASPASSDLCRARV